MLNGIQTQSARVYNLIAELPVLRALGVDVLRLSPQSQHMAETDRPVGADALDGALSPQDGAGAHCCRCCPAQPATATGTARPAWRSSPPPEPRSALRFLKDRP